MAESSDAMAVQGQSFREASINIVHLVRSLELGGLERLVVDLAIAQKQASNCAVIYSVYRHEPALIREAERAGVRVVQFNKETGFSGRTLWEIARQLRRDRPSIVHTHNELVHTYGTIAGLLAGVPCIVNTNHGGKRRTDRRLDRNYRALFPWTDALVSVSGETGTLFSKEDKRYPGKFHVILNGIPVRKFMAQSALPGSQWPRIRFGTVARLAEVKDQATLIRAFHIVRRTYPAAELHLLGDGPLRNNLEALSKRLELNGSISFHGVRSNVAEFLSTLDVFVLSSLNEGLPIAILEAMSAGLPIVSTRVGGICEAAPERAAAAYCPPGDPGALARAMKSILEPERMGTMGKMGQRIVQNSFAIEATARSYETLYRRLLSRKSLRGAWLLPRLT